MIAYENILAEVKEWKDSTPTSKGLGRSPPRRHHEESPRNNYSVSPSSALTNAPIAVKQNHKKCTAGRVDDDDDDSQEDRQHNNSTLRYHHQVGLAELDCASTTPRRQHMRPRNNIIPLRQAVTPRDRDPHRTASPSSACKRRDEILSSRWSPRHEAAAGGGGGRGSSFIRRSTIERLSTPRKSSPRRGSSPQQGVEGAEASRTETGESHHHLTRSESFKKSLREIEEQKAKARAKPGELPFVIGGAGKNVGWHKHLPTPPGLEAIRQELKEKRQKNGVSEADAKLVERLSRWPNRPKEKFAEPREPLTDEEEAALVKRLYTVKHVHGTGSDDDDDEGGDGGEGLGDVDIDEQVNRLYYKAMEQLQRKKQAAL